LKTKELTSRQREALEFIQEFIANKGYSPSLTEIGNGIDLASKSTTHGIITRLQEKGYITQEAKSPRSIRVTGQEDEMSRLRNRVAELEALLQQRPDISTMNGHDEKLATVIDELKAVGI
jgi:SOS-response transcriptional repressor LexA